MGNSVTEPLVLLGNTNFIPSAPLWITLGITTK